MAWVDQSSDFGYGTKLTSTQMQNLRDNLQAFADQDSGAPSYTYGAGTVDQAALKTDTEEETADMESEDSQVFVFSSVGEYGFYPQVKFEANTNAISVNIYGCGAGESGPTSYQTSILIAHDSGDSANPADDRNVYAQIRYVTASGEIYWLYVLKDTEKGKYLRMHGCPDHPCICCHDPEMIHHPFTKAYDEAKHVIFCIPLSKAERKEIEDLREWKNEIPQLTFLETVKKYFTVDENPKDAKWPDIPVTIGVDRKRRVMKAKIPQRDYIKQAALIRKK